MNQENLTPFTSETGRAAGRKGGIASAEAKRKRKQIKEYIDIILEDDTGEPVISNAEMIAVQMVNQAKKGNLKAIRLLLQLLGELDKDKVRIDINANVEESEAYKKGYADCQRYFFERLPDDILRKWASEDEGEPQEVQHDPKVLAEICGLTYTMDN